MMFKLIFILFFIFIKVSIQSECPVKVLPDSGNILNCSNRHVDSIKSYIFPSLKTHNHNIFQIDLKNNDITTIKYNDFIHCDFIYLIDLSNNRINHIDDGAFRHCKSLKVLNMSNNSISHLTRDLFYMNDNNKTVLKALILRNNENLENIPYIYLKTIEHVEMTNTLYLNRFNTMWGKFKQYFYALPAYEQVKLFNGPITIQYDDALHSQGEPIQVQMAPKNIKMESESTATSSVLFLLLFCLIIIFIACWIYSFLKIEDSCKLFRSFDVLKNTKYSRTPVQRTISEPHLHPII